MTTEGVGENVVDQGGWLRIIGVGVGKGVDDIVVD
jgi:hypothetical protein